MQTANHFGHWLRREIQNLGITQVEFCRQFGFPRPTMNVWTCSASPRILGHNIVRLARALGITRETIEAKLAETEAAQGAGAAA